MSSLAVSVVVPVYNVERYIDPALRSLLAQTRSDFEVVIVDDGSRDHSIEIARRVVAGDARFKFVHQANSGLGAARIAGVHHAQADHITFFDSDDLLRANALDVLCRAQAASGAEVVSARFERIDEEGRVDPVVTDRLKQHEIPNGLDELELWQAVLGAFSPSISCARLYHRSALERIAPMFPANLPHEDLFFTYKVLREADGHSAPDDIISQYRQRSDSLSKGVSRRHIDAFFAQIEDTQRYVGGIPGGSDLNRALAARRTLIMLHCLRSRLSHAPKATQDAFEARARSAARELKRQLAAFSSSDLKSAFVPPQSVRYVESLQPHSGGGAVSRAAMPAILSTYKEREAKPITYDDRARLEALHNRFKGKRAFIVGNGPSLNRHDLSLLNGEYVFGVNSIFLKSRETGFKPTFFVVEDSKVYEENLSDIVSYDAPFKFFPVDYRDKYGPVDGAYYFEMNQGFYLSNSPNYCIPRFSTDISKQVYCGQKVTYINMQIAFHLGFEEVYLIGMDFKYDIPSSHKRNGNHIISTTDDPNHFHKDYFGVGKTWKDPKLDRVAMNYRQARLSYEAAGRKVYNATIGGELEIFERVDYETLLRNPATGEKRRPASPSQTCLRSPAALLPVDEPRMASDAPSDQAGSKRSINVAERSPDHADGASSSSDAVTRPWYAPIGDAIRRSAPWGFGPARLARRLVLRLARSPLAWGAAVAGVVALGLVGLFGLVAVLSLRTRRNIQALVAENQRLSMEIGRIHDLAAGREGRVDRLVAAARLASEAKSLAQAAGGEARQARARADQAHASLDASARQSAAFDLRLAKVQAELDSGLNHAAAGLAQKETELKETISDLEIRLESLLKKQSASLRASMARSVQATKQRERAIESRVADEGRETAERLERLIEALQGELSQGSDLAQSALSEAVEQIRSELGIAKEEMVRRFEASGVEEFKGLVSERVSNLRDEIKAVREGLEQRMHAEIAEISGRYNKEAVEQMRGELGEAKEEIDQRFKSSRIEDLENLANEEINKLRDEINSVRREFEQRLHAEIKEFSGQYDKEFEDRMKKVVALASEAIEADISATRDQLKSEFATELEKTRSEQKSSNELSKSEVEAAAKRLDGRISSLSNALSDTRSLSFPTATVLRMLRRRGPGETAVAEVAQSPEFEHGHQLMMAVLADIESGEPGALSGRSLIEIGTTRELVPSQGSTYKLGLLSALLGMRFTSVDMDPANTNSASRGLQFVNPSASAITARGEVYLGKAERVEFIYLDAFDFEHENHSDKRRQAYEQNLGMDISDEACWEMHLSCARLIAARLADDGVLVLDDTWTSSDGAWVGKGKTAVPYLLDEEFEIMARTNRAVAMRRCN